MAVPDDPNDGSLLSIINIYAGEAEYGAAKDLLRKMGLPNAQEGEYFLGPNVARLYLSEGLSVSFAFRNADPIAALWGRLFPSKQVEAARVYAARKLKDPQILQPLWQCDLDKNCCAEIVAGTPRAKVGKDDLDAIGDSLKQRKIDFYNRAPEFVGVVRTKDGEEERLITNRRAVRLMKTYEGKPSGHLGMQEKIYGPLRAEFERVGKLDSASGWQALFRECAQSPDGVLHCYWNNPGAGTERNSLIRATAHKYAERRAAL